MTRAAFQVWGSGIHTQTSRLVLMSVEGIEELDLFLERAKQSFAELRTFEVEQEAIDEYMAEHDVIYK
jgi:hypothetical protein